MVFHTGQKKSAKDFLEERYEIMSSHLPPNWFPDSVILEGMFMIQTIPYPGSTMKQYVTFLLNRFTGYYFSNHVEEVHIVFDHAGRIPEHPKQIERLQRSSTKIHHHTIFLASYPGLPMFFNVHEKNR